MPAMTAVTKPFPLPQSGTVPPSLGPGLSRYRQSVQTVQEGVRRARIYHVVTDGGTVGNIEIATPFSVVTAAIAKKVSDSTYRAITIIPKSTAPGTAVVSGLAISTTYLITIYGR